MDSEIRDDLTDIRTLQMVNAYRNYEFEPKDEIINEIREECKILDTNIYNLNVVTLYEFVPNINFIKKYQNYDVEILKFFFEKESEEKKKRFICSVKYLAKVGNDSFQRILAHCYYYGLGVATNYKKAFRWINLSGCQNLIFLDKN